MTILEQLQSAFPDVEGIGDARNIAEALAMISGAGGRGANAIADKVSNPGGSGGDDEQNLFYLLALGGTSLISSTLSNITDINNKAGSIASYAFWRCTNLKTASFPNASYINEGAFDQLASLTTISFPITESIGTRAFNECSSLKEASFPNASYIGEKAFADCSSLISVSFPIVTSIGASAFINCFSLTEVSFPNVNYIDGNVFFNCQTLATASFPKVENIAGWTFNNCYNLVSLYLTGGSMSQVPTLGSSAFNSSPIGGYSASAGQYGSVYVPASLYSAFLSADNWSSIASRIVSVPES